jgi:hypothetical protein
MLAGAKSEEDSTQAKLLHIKAELDKPKMQLQKSQTIATAPPKLEDDSDATTVIHRGPAATKVVTKTLTTEIPPANSLETSKWAGKAPVSIHTKPTAKKGRRKATSGHAGHVLPQHHLLNELPEAMLQGTAPVSMPLMRQPPALVQAGSRKRKPASAVRGVAVPVNALTVQLK